MHGLSQKYFVLFRVLSNFYLPLRFFYFYFSFINDVAIDVGMAHPGNLKFHDNSFLMKV